MSIDISEHPSHSHSFSAPLSLKDWQSMKKVLYKLYLDLYQKRTLCRKSYITLSKRTIRCKTTTRGSSSWADEASDATVLKR